MILSDVFERFARDCPLPVMAQGVLENALSPWVVDQLFEDVAERQYTRKLLFSSIVDLMGLVVCRIRPAIAAAYQARAEVIEASLKAVYDKIDRTEPGLSAALVRMVAARLAPVIEQMKGTRPELLPGYHVKILDGNHLAGTEHRLKELRTTAAGALPGQALVVLDPARQLITDLFPCEDGHAQERALLDQVVATSPSNVGVQRDKILPFLEIRHSPGGRRHAAGTPVRPLRPGEPRQRHGPRLRRVRPHRHRFGRTL